MLNTITDLNICFGEARPELTTTPGHPRSSVVDYLSFSLHQPVVDRTGLKAFLLHYAPAGARATQSPTGTAASADAPGASQVDIEVAPTQG